MSTPPGVKRLGDRSKHGSEAGAAIEPAVSPVSRVLEAISRTRGPARLLAPRVDRMRSGGLRTLLLERRAAPAHDRQLAANRGETYRQMWRHAAEQLGAEVEQLSDGFMVIRLGKVETIVWQNLVMLDHPSTTAFALNKALVHEVLAGSGIAVPEHLELDRRRLRAATPFVLGAPAGAPGHVVKPAAGTAGGAGVICNVRTPDELVRAWLAAGRWADRILVERQVAGQEYRLLFLDGELLGAVGRRPAAVTGDGSSTVAQLIAAENRRRLSSGHDEAARLIRVDLDCELALTRQGCDIRSVPPRGDRVEVTGKVSYNAAAENDTVESLAPELVAQCARAARLARLRLAGIDLVTPDTSVPLHVAGGAVLEVNGTPGLHYHYQVADPPGAAPVAVPVLARLLGVDCPSDWRRGATPVSPSTSPSVGAGTGDGPARRSSPSADGP